MASWSSVVGVVAIAGFHFFAFFTGKSKSLFVAVFFGREGCDDLLALLVVGDSSPSVSSGPKADALDP